MDARVVLLHFHRGGPGPPWEGPACGPWLELLAVPPLRPLPGGGNSQDAELARLGRGTRPALKPANAFPPRPVYYARSYEADAVIVISRAGAQAQREDVERDWPQLEGGRVGAPAAPLSAHLSPSIQGHCMALALTEPFGARAW